MHENHRDRLRERFLSEGLDSFQPHEALELLLFYAIPRRDTNELAHRLLQHFGSLDAVFDAHPQELEQVSGMGRNSAVMLAMMAPLWRMYRREGSRSGKPLDNHRAASDYLKDLFAGRTNEALYLLCLDPHCRLIKDVLLLEGTINEVAVHPRTVVEAALRCKATQVIVAHNHPKGKPEPSVHDIDFTRGIALALSTIGIPLIDHIIVSFDEIYSFAHAGRMAHLLSDDRLRHTLDACAQENSQELYEKAPAGVHASIRKYSAD